MYKANITMAALAIIAFALSGIGNAGPWVPIVKDGQENTLTTSSHQGVINLVGSSSVAFHYLRGNVKAAIDPTKVEKRPDYGVWGTLKQLSSFPDDVVPISENDYAWQARSPIYWNPHMDYNYGYQVYNLEGDYGGEWWTPVPSRFDEWQGYNSTKISFDKDQIALDTWANAAV